MAAWHADDGSVWARYIGGDSGFGYNFVTGQNADFRATHPAITTARTGAAVAIGGDGFGAIGWQDTSAEHPGVYVRRFPMPN